MVLSLRSLVCICVYGILTATFYTFLIGSFGAGTLRIRFEPTNPQKYVLLNCNRDEIVNENGEIKTPLDHDLDGQHPWHLENYPDIPNLHVIKWNMSHVSELRDTMEFKRFQERKRILERSCTMARQLIFSKKLSFKNLVNLQKQVIGKGKKDEKACTPILPIKLAKNEQFYNDEYKFSMCLPPKTGCTNWQRGMVALLKNGEKTPEELTDYEVFYDLDRFNSTDMKKERATRSSSSGYLTMVNSRHPMARLLSAWHDKFRKGHPWMKYIEKRYGPILRCSSGEIWRLRNIPTVLKPSWSWRPLRIMIG